MTMRVLFSSVMMTVFLMANVQAHEGMWIPMLLKELNEPHMKASGLKLSAEDIYSVNSSSLKDAVVHFGGGCTAEIISSSGLLLTNHHCGYGQIQKHSSLENDYLSDGFWAQDRAQELPNEGLTATLIVRMEDVTAKVLEGVEAGMEEKDRSGIITTNIRTITKAATENTHYDAYIRPFYHGNAYYMFITETFKDVRLVGAPPSSIGKFGFDTDNWVWPRHTGDFSVFRIYADKDNKPAEYSEDNVPYQPRHFFPISLKGVNDGDFTMVYGFPGRTSEYLPSQAVAYTLEQSNPARIKMRKTSLEIIDRAMRSDKKINIQYAAKQSRISNAYKKWIGQSKGLIRLDAVDRKKALEARFAEQVAGSPERKEKYGHLLTGYEKHYGELASFALARDYFIEIVYYGPEVIRFANSFQKLIRLAGEKDNAEALAEEVEKRKKNNKAFFKNYHEPTDRALFGAMMELYHDGVDPALVPPLMNEIRAKHGSYSAFAEQVYAKSLFTDEARLNAFMEKFKPGSAKKLAKDPLFQLMESIFNTYFNAVSPRYREINAQISGLDRQYMKGLMELLPSDKKYYPDANSTLRLTYGKVDGYEPQDGVVYDHYTTLDGVIEKYEPGSYEYDVPERLRELHANKDFGPYAQDGEVRVCFTASNHTTGGNSGSPVLDGEGNLIGLNFDRSWESTMSDIVYDPSICRNIAVDIRYVLFIIDKFAGADHLVKEMKLVR